MIKKSFILSIICLLFIQTTPKKSEMGIELKNASIELLNHNIPHFNSDILFIKNNFIAFKEAVAFKESQGKYNVVNTLGYLGKYQFGKSTLKRFKIYDTNSFLKNPELQEKAFVALCKVNKWILRRDIKKSVGTIINGIHITESGILAAAHLGGAGNVKKYLRSKGNQRFRDAYGASIEFYIRKFANYDVSNITPDRKATV